MSQQARIRYVKLQKMLPKLMAKVTTAQARLHSIDNHLALSLVAVNKSATSSVDGVPTQFTDAFERYSELLNVSVEEMANVLLETCEAIEQIEVATQQIVVGINMQINPSSTAQQQVSAKEGPSTSRNSTQLVHSSKLQDMTLAIASLEAKIRGNSP